MLAYVSEKSGEKTEVWTAFKIRDPLICEVKGMINAPSNGNLSLQTRVSCTPKSLQTRNGKLRKSANLC